MMLARLRGAAIGGLAVLLLSGAGIAFAATPATVPAPAPVRQLAAPAQPATGGSSTSGQQVDVQQGDQTAPDAAGTTATETAGAEAPETTAEAASGAAEAPESATEAGGTETDGPGGHADAAGANVDYQFQGEQ